LAESCAVTPQGDLYSVGKIQTKRGTQVGLVLIRI
jgi:hypothetical protein